MLSLANALSFVARTVISLLVDPIRADLHVSDTAVSILQGISFSLTFAIIGLPMALLADRGNRRNIIAISILVWSIMTALCGAARSYGVLLAGRIGAGAGEGGFGPASQAILADFFPRERLPLATAVYSMGIYIGSGVALIAGGAVIQWASGAGAIVVPVLGVVKAWQLTFFAVAAPGILLALIMLLTVKEPERKGGQAEVATPDHASIADVVAHVKGRRLAYVGLLLGFSLHVLVAAGAAAWTPALLSRHFHLSPSEIGNIYGLIFLICGAAGALSGGAIASALLRRGVAQANALVPFAAYAIEVLFALGYTAADSPAAIWTCIAGMTLFSSAAIGSGFTLVNEWAPNRMRAQVGALLLLFLNVVGTGLGPLVVASLSDGVFTGTFALAHAIALTALLVGLPATALLWLAVRHYPGSARPQSTLHVAGST
jgi:MFS family permease